MKNEFIVNELKTELSILESSLEKNDEDLKEIEEIKQLIYKYEKEDTQILSLSEEQLSNLIKDIAEKGFYCDGCFCGNYTYSFSDDLHLDIYRSCHKSSMCPPNQNWNLGSLGLFKKLTVTSDWERYGEDINLLNVLLDPKQEKLIRIHLDRRSEFERGSQKYWYDDEANSQYQGVFNVLKIEDNQKIIIATDLSINEANKLLQILANYNSVDSFIIEEIMSTNEE